MTINIVKYLDITLGPSIKALLVIRKTDCVHVTGQDEVSLEEEEGDGVVEDLGVELLVDGA